MKYIRTDDGIYEYVDYDNECIIPSPIVKYKNKLTHCSECDIINQADTIEELCDEFVIKMGDEHISKRTMLELIDMSSYVQAIYGTIWTDKGLIYVAKMNGRGELELL